MTKIQIKFPKSLRINMESFIKGERRIKVKGTSKRKAHYRTIKGSDKPEIKPDQFLPGFKDMTWVYDFENYDEINDILLKQKDEDGWLPIFENMIISVGGEPYYFIAEAWYDECLESRGYEIETTPSNIKDSFKGIAQEETKLGILDHAEYLSNSKIAEYGVSYVTKKVPKNLVNQTYESQYKPEVIAIKNLVKVSIDKLKEHPEIVGEIRDTKNLIESGKTSKSENLTPDGEYTPERKVLHAKIMHDMFKDAKPSDNPEIIFVGGGPGSGKGTLVDKIENVNNYVYLNNDEIKKELPGYLGTKAAYYHNEARDICNEIKEKAKELRMNIILDATLRNFDRSVKTIETFKSLGYRTKLLSTNLSVDKALDRAVNRTISEERRFVPLTFIAEVTEPTNKNQFKYLKYVDSGEIFNTDVKRGEDFILMEKK